jgi:hypothetical protein
MYLLGNKRNYYFHANSIFIINYGADPPIKYASNPSLSRLHYLPDVSNIRRNLLFWVLPGIMRYRYFAKIYYSKKLSCGVRQN